MNARNQAVRRNARVNVRISHFARACAILLLTPCLCAVAMAGPIDGYILPSILFGHMAQPDAFSCGPTSGVNSMVFLQAEYAQIYGTKLVGPTPADQLAAEKELAIDMVMTTGVDDYHFITGKKTYFKEHSPGTTSVGAEMAGNWWDPPPGVIPHTKPTADYIISNLKRKRDVEIDVLITTNGKLEAHEVTVTGMTWDGTQGGIYYIDPTDGKLKKQLISKDDEGYLSWQSADESSLYEIRAAVWEGPAPEPGSILLLGLGILGVSSRFFRRRWARSVPVLMS